MSGSPVYLDGRLAGAVAFAWPFSLEAIAGITPIANMRQIGADAAPSPVPTTAARATGAASAHLAPPPAVPLADLVAGKVPADLLERYLERLVPRPAAGAVPGFGWAVSGFGPQARALLERSLGASALGGLTSLGSAVPTAAATAAGADDPGGTLVPGGAVAAVLMDGDMRMAATGTVTDVVGDRVLAFGHPFLGLGPVSIPMADAEVVTVLASDYSSFKISNMGSVVGAFEQDRQAGIQGRLGLHAPTLPLHVKVQGDESAEYDMRLAELPQLTPALIAVASLAGLNATTYASGNQGVDLAARFRLAGHGDLEVRQSFDGENAAPSAAAYLLSFASFLLGNDLEEVDLERVDVEITQVPRPRTATLTAAYAERSHVRPGDRVRLNLDFSPWRGDDFRRGVEVALPEDLEEGRYYLFVGDGPSVDATRQLIEHTQPETFHQALRTLRSLHSRRQLLVLGVAAGPGLAVAGEAMPNLPGTVRSIWSAAPTGSATPLRLAVSQQQVEPSDVPLSGLVRVDLTVERREPLRSDADGDGDADGGESQPSPPVRAPATPTSTESQSPSSPSPSRGNR